MFNPFFKITNVLSGHIGNVVLEKKKIPNIGMVKVWYRKAESKVLKNHKH